MACSRDFLLIFLFCFAVIKLKTGPNAKRRRGEKLSFFQAMKHESDERESSRLLRITLMKTASFYSRQRISFHYTLISI